MKFLLFCLFFSVSSAFSNTATMDFEIIKNSQKDKFRIITKLGKQATIQRRAMGKNRFEVSILPQKAEVANTKGLILKLKIKENEKLISSPTLFVKNNKEAEFSRNNFPNAPKNFKLRIKASHN